MAIERSVQRALDAGVASRLLSDLYLGAQLVVLPAALIWLHRRSPPIHRRLRSTVIATWLSSVPIFALFPSRHRAWPGSGSPTPSATGRASR